MDGSFFRTEREWWPVAEWLGRVAEGRVAGWAGWLRGG